MGSVFDALNLGGGIENVYTADRGRRRRRRHHHRHTGDAVGEPRPELRCSAASTPPCRWTPGDAFTAGLDAATAAASAIDPAVVPRPLKAQQAELTGNNQTSQALCGLGCLALRPRRGKRMKRTRASSPTRRRRQHCLALLSLPTRLSVASSRARERVLRQRESRFPLSRSYRHRDEWRHRQAAVKRGLDG